uniref:Uncharacterized protein n=1 Tax=Salmonella sp. TaxID=599 RepID=A0A482ETU8_SALSP|nr:hypothetical protein [Salmonella sp.]QBM91551.1 hypothetical protein NNIBIDOC_00225 [Salmonella sp.]
MTRADNYKWAMVKMVLVSTGIPPSAEFNAPTSKQFIAADLNIGGSNAKTAITGIIISATFVFANQEGRRWKRQMQKVNNVLRDLTRLKKGSPGRWQTVSLLQRQFSAAAGIRSYRCIQYYFQMGTPQRRIILINILIMSANILASLA